MFVCLCAFWVQINLLFRTSAVCFKFNNEKFFTLDNIPFVLLYPQTVCTLLTLSLKQNKHSSGPCSGSNSRIRYVKTSVSIRNELTIVEKKRCKESEVRMALIHLPEDSTTLNKRLRTQKAFFLPLVKGGKLNYLPNFAPIVC